MGSNGLKIALNPPPIWRKEKSNLFLEENGDINLKISEKKIEISALEDQIKNLQKVIEENEATLKKEESQLEDLSDFHSKIKSLEEKLSDIG